MSRISVCIIARNEAENIQRCLASVRGNVDEIIVVDTGSTDETPCLAEQAGAKVISFTWNGNFSDARNVSLAHATGEWIFFMDADEELTSESMQALQRIVQEEKEGYFVKIINLIGEAGRIERCPDLVFRIFRNRPEYRFRGAIHEQIADVILERNQSAKYQVAEDVVLIHYGYLNNQVEAKDKKNRNITIVQRELEQQPENILLRYHYAVELFRADRWQEAVDHFTHVANNTDPASIFFPKLLRYLMLSYYGLKQHKNALEIIDTALKLYPNYADLYYYGGLIHVEQKNYPKAYECFGQAIEMPEQPAYYAPFSGSSGFRALYQLGQLAELFCNEEEAMRYYILSLRDNPQFAVALHRIIYLLEPRCDPEYCRGALQKICDFCTDESKRMAANILFAEQAYGLALDHFAQVDPATFDPYMRVKQAICYIQEKRFLEGIRILDDISPEDAVYPLARLNRLFCFWIQGSRAKVRELCKELLDMGLTADTGAVVIALRDSLYKKAGYSPVGFGEEGMALIEDILARALNMGEFHLGERLLARVDKYTQEQYALRIGQIFAQHARWDEAEIWFDRGIKVESENADAIYRLAQIHVIKGNTAEAIPLLRRALSIEPSCPKYYEKLIRVYEAKRREVIDMALQRFPDNLIFKRLLEGEPVND